MSFWKSRYTASLEAQVADLKKQVAAKDDTIKWLMQSLMADPPPGQIIPVSGETAKAFRNIRPDAKQRPPVSNFLQSRAILESASARGIEVGPAEPKENEANHGT